MAILQIITAPDPILEKRSLEVGVVDQDIQTLMTDMLATMYENNGVGLAAVQVGILKRIIVLDLQNDDEVERKKGFYPLFMADSKITAQSNEKISKLEGCLSVPEQRIAVERPESIIVEYTDYNNKKQKLEAAGWLARAIQHEIDHTDGKLLIHYLSLMKQDIVKRKLQKRKRHSL
ncbi:MAG: peptide deformylase [Rickettsiaceae bacterium]|nr:MAG: peptide deformylase [Rickettsiaceae bacterium]